LPGFGRRITGIHSQAKRSALRASLPALASPERHVHEADDQADQDATDRNIDQPHDSLRFRAIRLT